MIHHIGSHEIQLTTCQTCHMRREYMRLSQRVKRILPYDYKYLPRLTWLKELFVMLEEKKLAAQFVNNAVRSRGLSNIFSMKDVNDPFTLDGIGFFAWDPTKEGWDFWRDFSVYAINTWREAYSFKEGTYPLRISED